MPGTTAARGKHTQEPLNMVPSIVHLADKIPLECEKDLSWVLCSTPAPFAISSPLQFRGSQLTCTLESAMVRCTPDTLEETPWGGTQALAFFKLL